VQDLVDDGMLEEPLDGNHGAIHPKSSDYVDKGIPFIMASDLHDGTINYSTCKYISEAHANTLRKGFAKPGDVLLTHKATLGRTAIIDDKYDYVVLTPQVTYYRTKLGFNNKYLKYYFDSSEFQATLLNWAASGSTRSYLGITAQRKLPVVVPPSREQQVIADTLSSLDNKIANNTKINNHLEQMARAIWAERFGEREPNGILDDVIELFDSKRVPLSGNQRANMEKIYPYYGAASLMDYVDDYLFDGVYLLLGEDGTVIDDVGFPILQYVCGKFWVNNHAHILQGKNSFTVESLYTLLKQTSVASIVTGAVQPKINQANLKALEVVVPSAEEMAEFNTLIAPLFAQIRNNNDENFRLATMRDTLLPRLMSGELSVADLAAKL